MNDVTEAVRSYWDIDAKTYDDSASHHPRSAAEQAAWSAALRRLLPPPPAKVLDVGAGTGFVSILLARQGYAVTALDLAPGMLARLKEKARAVGLDVRTTEGDAADPPRDNFDAVVERHLLWTLWAQERLWTPGMRLRPPVGCCSSKACGEHRADIPSSSAVAVTLCCGGYGAKGPTTTPSTTPRYVPGCPLELAPLRSAW